LGVLGSRLLVRLESTADALRVPRLPRAGLSFEELGDKARDVRIGAWIAGLRAPGGAGVVDVVTGLPPGVEDHLLIGPVRVQRGDDALDRVVEQRRADAGRHAELEGMRGGEEGLVLADRIALVVEDGPAGAHPSRLRLRTRLRLSLLLYLPA